MKRIWELALIAALISAGASAQTNVTTSGGTTNTVPVYMSSSILGNSPISVSGSNVGIGTTSPQSVLHVLGGDWNGITLTSTVNSNAKWSLKPSPLDTYMGKRFLMLSDETPNTDGQSGGLMFRTNNGPIEGYTDPRMVIRETGNVGIGTMSPSEKLDVSGNIQVSGNLKLATSSGAHIVFADGSEQSVAWTGVLSGGDYAESVDISDTRESLEPGDLIVIDPEQNGRFLKSDAPYSPLIGGVYATKPGVTGRRQPRSKSNEDEVPMAMVGIVPTKVSAENGPIRRGDLLVSSSTPGYAMKGTDRDKLTGAVLGKALGTLESGKGVIEVLISLQ